MTQVLVVDDSRFMRTVLGDALEREGYDIVRVDSGEAAVEYATTHDPDVVTMDVEMPGMSGIEAVERIMSTNPTSILMLSAHTERGADATLDALARGAVDFLHKPDGSDSRNLAHLVDDLVGTVESIVAADVSSVALARAAATARRMETHARKHKRTIPAGGAVDEGPVGEPLPVGPFVDDPTIVVGASTGGPRILERFMARLPAELDAKLLVVQHMPAAFTERFADRLDEVSDYDVFEAAHSDRLAGGQAVVAAGDHHLEVASNRESALRVRRSSADRVHGVRPAIDVTMETAAEVVSDPLCGIVLTGMGRDGARGIEAVAGAGGHTIAQDERTSPVFGIPRQAIATGCVEDVVPADRLVERVLETFTVGEIDG